METQNMCETILDDLKRLSTQCNKDINTEAYAKYLDERDDIKYSRSYFNIPKNKDIPNVDLSLVEGDGESLYFSGNSLGLCPKLAESEMIEELKKWQHKAVYGHFEGKYPWADLGDESIQTMASLVGGKEVEVGLMSSLTANLHLLMVSFYNPTKQRHKIIIEEKAFISDHVAMESQIRFHGYDPEKSLILVKPREGEMCLRTEDILDVIEREGDETALIMFSGVQYYTGQNFDMESITKAGIKKGCKVGFDLAHAVGNVELKLHDWNVDFACWCSYKYLNAGPGAIGGIFLHEKYAADESLKKFLGWWGVTYKERFTMNAERPIIAGAKSYALSNVPVFSAMPLVSSLQIFKEVGFDKILAKQKLLTGYLEYLIRNLFSENEVTIYTPSNPKWRGCQLSLAFNRSLENVVGDLKKRGVTADIRRPNVVRIAPIPLYNTYLDVFRFCCYLKAALVN